ncbi:MAG: putative glycoside hydrolase [Armatimonadota bacterium]
MEAFTNRADTHRVMLNNPSLRRETPIRERTANRTFPSIFQAWNAAEIPGEEKWTSVARHDIVFHAPDFFGLRWNHAFPGLATSFTQESIAAAKSTRKRLLERNPNVVLLAELRYRDAHRSHLPDGHHWWLTRNGKPVVGWEEGGYFLIDYTQAVLRDHIAKQAKALINTGVMDGIMLDWWDDDDDRIALLNSIRQYIGDAALILVNANDRKVPRSAKLINGLFMECYKSAGPDDWKRITETLSWAEASVRQPRINCLETWHQKSRADVALMRATTTLALTMSDGYCLFSDPNPLPTPDHLHDWYPFWDCDLGKPLEKGRRSPDGSFQRRFTNGIAVHNPPGNRAIVMSFSTPHQAASTGVIAKRFTLDAGDGDIFIPSKHERP